MTTFSRAFASASALTLLLACGGGGGGGSTTPTPAPSISSISPSSAPAGATVTLSGANLSGATAVSFNGTPAASFTATASAISAVVPAGATAGPITVTTPGGVATSPTFTRLASALAYTDPASGTYRLVKNTALSTATHLVLDLLGPAGTQGRGVGFYLTADTTKVTWTKVASSDADLVQNGAFSLGSAPQLLKAKATGDELQAGVYQKGGGVPAVTFTATGALARVALDLKGNPALGTVTFTAPTNKAVVLPASGAQTTIQVSVGTLSAQ
jgi:hypothetical protein